MKSKFQPDKVSLASPKMESIHPKQEKVTSQWIEVDGKLVCEWRVVNSTEEADAAAQRQLYYKLELIDQSGQ